MNIAPLSLIAFTVFLLTPPVIAADINVDQAGQKFAPSQLTLKAGDTVNFLNTDDVNHNVTVIDTAGNSDDRGIQKPGTTVPVNFAKPGEYTIRCSVHPRMKMQIKVE